MIQRKMKKVLLCKLLLLLFLMNLYTGHKTSVYVQICIVSKLLSMSVLLQFKIKLIHISETSAKQKVKN